MKLEDVARRVEGIPYMQLKQAKRIEKIVTKYNCKALLELGFFHGVSSVYMAAMLQNLGGARSLTSIDKPSAKKREPNLGELAADLGLSEIIEPFYEPGGYLWRLKAFIEEGRRFDFCYLDGGHTWADTGFAFYLVDQLLVDGGLILFDDMNWTPAHMPWAQNLPEEERTTAAVERVWSLLAMPHPNYKKVWVKGNWALARKKRKIPLLPLRY